jgi:uncharacterized membrane protein
MNNSVSSENFLWNIGIVALLLWIAVTVFMVIASWRIFSRAGYAGALGLLMFVPIVNLVMLYVLAFREWPIYKELQALRTQADKD